MDFCRRKSGRTTAIINLCIDHLLCGHDTLIVVSFNNYACDIIVNSLKGELNISYPNIFREINHAHSKYIQLYNTSIMFCTMDNIESHIHGRRVKDIIFDTPEYDLFNMQKLSMLIPYLIR